MIKLFAAFAFAEERFLGFDTTIQPVTGDRRQFDITVHPHNDKENSRTFRTIRVISSYGAEPIRGRGARVFEAVELDRNGEPNGPHVVLKDMWIDSDRMREGTILTSLYEAAEDEDKRLVEKHSLTTICHGDVWTEVDILDDTANALMRGFSIASGHDSHFELPWTPYPYRLHSSHSRLRYADKTHYRIVFKEICITIGHIRSLPDVMVVLVETVAGSFLYYTIHL